MQFRVLGPLQVVSDGEPLPLGGSTRRALLSYLLLRANRPVSADELSEAIWNGDPPNTAASSLQNHVFRLRKVLGADRVVTRSRGYELSVQPDELDLDRVETLVHIAEGLEPAAAAARLREALALWRGKPLAELDAFDFARADGLRLEDRRLGILEDCLDAEIAAGRRDGLVSELQGLVSEHPLRERLRSQLMLALYAQGRQADALDVYRSGREALVEVGLEPSPSLRELERAILRHEVASPDAATGAQSRSPPVRDRTRVGVVVLAALVVALASIVGGLIATRGGSPAALAGVAPNSLGAIDPDDNTLVAEIPVGRRPVSVAAGFGAVWVANAGDGTVSRVDARERRLVENIRARASFGSVRVGRDAVWAVGRSGHSPNYEAVVSRIDPHVGAVTTAARYPVISVRYDETIGVGEGFGSTWLTGGWQLLRLDGRNRLREVSGALSSARGVAVGEGSVWVGDIQHPISGASTVFRIDPRTNEVVARIPVAAEVASVAVGGGFVWVASDDGTLTKIDPEANVVADTVKLGGALSDVAVGEGAVWVANSGARNVARVDPETNDVVATIPTRARPDAIAVGEGLVWVTAY